MKVLIITLLFAQLVHSSQGLSYYPTKVQEIFSNSSMQEGDLKDLIYKLLSQTHQRVENGNDRLGCERHRTGQCYGQEKNSYPNAKKALFGSLHLKKNDDGQFFVQDLYCNKNYTSGKNGVGSIGPGKVPNHTVMNCEHTWPQSRFSRKHSSSLQKGDLHHLYPADSKANSLRSSHKFGNVKDGRDVSRSCSASQFGNSIFQPPVKHRGNVARAVFYFSLRYQLRIKSSEENALKLWHEQDPVDAQEMKRNGAIEKIQRNRNPFIDYPHLVNLINDF